MNDMDVLMGCLSNQYKQHETLLGAEVETIIQLLNSNIYDAIVVAIAIKRREIQL